MFRTRSVRRGFTLVELLVVISIIGVLMSLLLPAINSARESGRIANCKSNLKNLGLATLECLAKTRQYPTGGWGPLWIGNADGGTSVKQPGGWVYNLLPYIEESSLHDLTQGMMTNDGFMKTYLIREAQTTQSILNCPTRRAVQSWPAQAAMNPYDPAGAGSTQVTLNTVMRGDFAANAGVRYDKPSATATTDTEQQYGCLLLNPGTDYPIKYSDGQAGINFNPLYRWTGVVFQRSQISDASVHDGTSKTYLYGEKFIDRRHYEDGLYLADAGNVYSGMGPDNYRTTFVLPATTTVDTTTGVDPTDPGNPALGATAAPPNNFGITMLNDQIDPGASPSQYGYYSCLFGSAHSGIVNFVFCDASTKSISTGIDPLTHRYLGERNDGKILDDAMIGQ